MDQRSYRFSVLALTIMTLAACGGSDGDGGTSDTDTTNSEPLAITPANAEQVAAEVFVNLDLATANASTDALPMSASPDAPVETLTLRDKLLLAAKASTAPLQKVSAGNAESPVVAAETQTFSDECQDGGSATISITSSDNSGYLESAGDKVSASYNNCTMSYAYNGQTYSTTMDGSVAVTMETPTGFPPVEQDGQIILPVSITDYAFDESSIMEQMRIDYGDFNITASNNGQVESVSMDGGITLKTAEDYINSVSFFAFSGDLTLASNSEAGDLEFSLANTSLLFMDDWDYEETFHTFTYESEALAGSGGSITFETLETVVDDADTLADLDMGKMKISGANGSTVTLTVLGANGVFMEIDADGDGVAEETRTLSWTEWDEL